MIALVFCGDLKYCPYMKRYLERLDEAKADYRVYFWSRTEKAAVDFDRYAAYDSASDLNASPAKKLLDFVGFRSWLLRQLKKDQPKAIIVLSTLTGIILGRFLYEKFKGRYIFDIRDYSYEHIAPFYAIEKRAIENSRFTAISSKGFQDFLPPHPYVIAHNFNRNDMIRSFSFQKKEAPLKFVWNGVMRYFEFQTQYLNALKNDSRFEMIYHGDGPEMAQYQKYCSENGFQNVRFTGSYNNAQKAELLADAAILNNCYGYLSGNPENVRHAVSNRFYDGSLYHIPQVVESDGFKAAWGKKEGIAVDFPPDDHFADRLFDYYQALDGARFDAACDAMIKKVIEEDDIYIARMDSFIQENK